MEKSKALELVGKLGMNHELTPLSTNLKNFERILQNCLNRYPLDRITIRRTKIDDKLGHIHFYEGTFKLRSFINDFKNYYGVGCDSKTLRKISSNQINSTPTIERIRQGIVYVTDLLKERHKGDIWHDITVNGTDPTLKWNKETLSWEDKLENYLH